MFWTVQFVVLLICCGIVHTLTKVCWMAAFAFNLLMYPYRQRRNRNTRSLTKCSLRSGSEYSLLHCLISQVHRSSSRYLVCCGLSLWNIEGVLRLNCPSSTLNLVSFQSSFSDMALFRIVTRWQVHYYELVRMSCLSIRWTCTRSFTPPAALFRKIREYMDNSSKTTTRPYFPWRVSPRPIG